MKKIICYGDSNTFGFRTEDFTRYGEDIRWTCLLQKNLGDGYEVVNEGMCDRTGFVDNPKGYLYSAQKHFPKLMEQFETIDLLILWIGTNDLQSQYDLSFDIVETGLDNLIKLAKEKTKNIIIIPPVILTEKVLEGKFNFQFDRTSVDKSKEIGKIFEKLAKAHNCEFFDINTFTTPSNVDGLHYDAVSHMLIAENLTGFIKL